MPYQKIYNMQRDIRGVDRQRPSSYGVHLAAPSLRFSHCFRLRRFFPSAFVVPASLEGGSLGSTALGFAGLAAALGARARIAILTPGLKNLPGRVLVCDAGRGGSGEGAEYGESTQTTTAIDAGSFSTQHLTRFLKARPNFPNLLDRIDKSIPSQKQRRISTNATGVNASPCYPINSPNASNGGERGRQRTTGEISMRIIRVRRTLVVTIITEP
ncbi:hypothetical protein BJ875DRAFT_540131 [Amylocarpus encephaloides]|uniref:Uncharacterized protein n=1 Tax=Amylocarpus encephaloides TaxID=45428 RepID=A0A9P7YRR8_9HELO|nr:hypothetical protein BJ875DRAFT_540131 [Amylocarpus encephaloides]